MSFLRFLEFTGVEFAGTSSVVALYFRCFQDRVLCIFLAVWLELSYGLILRRLCRYSGLLQFVVLVFSRNFFS